MGPTDFQRYRKLLLEKRRELSSAQSDPRALVPAAGGWEGDAIDQANADAEAELQIQLHRTDGRLARAIEEALVRITRRTYGVCEACAHPISKARLDAVPWTRLCRECKERKNT
jgi:DnaK suppressor protein